MTKYLLTFSLLFLVMVSFAQANKRPTKTKGLIYTVEQGVNLSLNSSGYSLGYSKGKLKSYQTTPFWQFELGRLKHAKEYKRSVDNSLNTRPYSFGKENVFFTARVLRGQKKYLTEKAKTKGVAIGWQYLGGLSLGLLKPYYLNIQRRVDPALPQDYTVTSEKYSLDNREDFLDNHAILGASKFWKGVGETKVLPGLHGRIGVLFDWGAFDETSKSVDAGVMIDVYPKAVPIMIDAKNYPFFLNLYINFQLGKRS